MLAKHDFWGLQYIYDDEKEDETRDVDLPLCKLLIH